MAGNTVRPLCIDFLPPALVPVWAVVVCTTLNAAALASGTWAWSAHAETRELVLRIANGQWTHQDARAVAQDSPKFVLTELPYTIDARRALEEARFITSRSLTTLECANVSGIIPTLVELRPESRITRVEVEFEELRTLMKFLTKLNTIELTHRWQILRATINIPGQTVGVATVEAKWSE
jgi:hypothetical protein